MTLSAVRWGLSGLREPDERPGRRGAGTGGGCDAVGTARRAAARLLATMALLSESRVRFEAEAFRAGRVGRSGVDSDQTDDRRLSCAGRSGFLSAARVGDLAQDCTEEADTNVSSDEAELCDSRRRSGVGIRSSDL
jgi:hypothetical protein